MNEPTRLLLDAPAFSTKFRAMDSTDTKKPVSPLAIWTALTAVYIIWGSTYFAIRVAIQTLPPLLMAGARFTVAGATLFAFSVRRGDRTNDRIGVPQWRAASIIGVLLLAAGNGGVVWAERKLSSGMAALLIATTPLWMALIDRIFYGHRLRKQAVAGFAFGFGGLAVLINPHGGFDFASALLVVVAALCWASGSVYARSAPLPKRPLVSTGMQMLAGGALLIIVGIASGEIAQLRAATASVSSIAALLYLIVFGAWIAFSAYAWLLRVAPISLVSTYAYVNPIVAVTLGWAFLSEPITPRMLLAGSVIIFGVGLIVTARNRRAATQ